MVSSQVRRGRAALLAAIALVALPGMAALPDRFGAWQAGPAQEITERQLEEAAGNNAALIREYGFTAASRREYTRGSDRLRVTEWEMKDASGSLGLFTYLNQPGMKAEKFGDAVATMADGMTLLWSGAFLLELRGPAIGSPDLESLSSLLPVTEEQRAILPVLPSFFPADDLLPMTRKYVLGPVGLSRVLPRIPAEKFALEPGTEAAVGKYRLGETTATLLLLFYPTPQLAAKKFTAILALPEISQSAGPLHNLAQRKSSLVAVVLDAPSVAEATQLLDRVSYESNLMWNEYVPPAGQNVGTLMLAIFALVGLILAFAIVAGVAFGGFRVFAKKYIPLPIFDRPEDVELVKLKLDEK